jgi:hypothetical protein
MAISFGVLQFLFVQFCNIIPLKNNATSDILEMWAGNKPMIAKDETDFPTRLTNDSQNFIFM